LGRVAGALLVALTLTVVSACADGGRPAPQPAPVAVSSQGAAQKAASPLAAPRPASASNDIADEYRLGPGDKLNLVVFGQQDLSGEFDVDGTGNLSLPLIGVIKAGGLTLNELREKIRTTLDKEYIVDPRISLDVVNYRPFFILGEVNRPGRYDYVNGLTVRQAVAIAGGFTRRGRESDIVLVRDGLPPPGYAYIQLDDTVLPGDTLEVERRLF
jgi:polysaccharide export outer membrane protein